MTSVKKGDKKKENGNRNRNCMEGRKEGREEVGSFRLLVLSCWLVDKTKRERRKRFDMAWCGVIWPKRNLEWC